MNTTTSRRLAIGAVSVILGLGVAACGGDSDDSGSKKKDNSPVNVDKDGDFEYDSGDGKVTGGKGLPKDFPKDDIPIIDGEATGAKVDSGAVQGFSVGVVTDGSAKDAFGKAKKLLADKGFEVLPGSAGAPNAGGFQSGKYQVIVSATAGGGKTVVTYIVSVK